MPDDLPYDASLAAQGSVLGRRQLRSHGYGPDRVRNQQLARRWQSSYGKAVVLHNGTLTDDERRWAAVLATASGGCALGGLTAAQMHGLRGFETPTIHLLTGKGRRLRWAASIEDVRVHETRDYGPALLHPSKVPPCTRLERALIDAAVWERSPRRAGGVLAAAVQQRLTVAARLIGELSTRPSARHRRFLLRCLRDIAGGAQSLAEIDVGRLCRLAGCPPPLRQQVRLDGHGRRRYLDVVLARSDGSTYVVEVDGALHLLAATYWDDMARSNELVIGGEAVLRFPTTAIYLDEQRVVDQLRRMYTAGGR